MDLWWGIDDCRFPFFMQTSVKLPQYFRVTSVPEYKSFSFFFCPQTCRNFASKIRNDAYNVSHKYIM